MDKGSVTVNAVYYMWKIFVIVIVVTAALVILKAFIRTDVEVVEAEAHMFFYRLLYQEGGLSYHDGSRVYPGVIDLDRFLNQTSFEEELDQRIYYDNDHIAAEIELYNMSGSLIGKAYFNKKHYFDTLPLSYHGEGPGAATRVVHVLYVLLKDQSILKERSLLASGLDDDYISYRLDQLHDDPSFEDRRLGQGRLVVTIVKQNT